MQEVVMSKAYAVGANFHGVPNALALPVWLRPWMLSPTT